MVEVAHYPRQAARRILIDAAPGLGLHQPHVLSSRMNVDQYVYPFLGVMLETVVEGLQALL